MSQLSLFESPPEFYTYYRGVPARKGILRYTHLIWSKFDPPETLGRGFKNGKKLGRAVDHWKRTFSVNEYKKKISELMKDGNARTFNRICVELTGTTASVWFEKEPDKALWALVEDGTLAWAQEEGCIFFVDSNFVNWN